MGFPSLTAAANTAGSTHLTTTDNCRTSRGSSSSRMSVTMVVAGQQVNFYLRRQVSTTSSRVQHRRQAVASTASAIATTVSASAAGVTIETLARGPAGGTSNNNSHSSNSRNSWLGLRGPGLSAAMPKSCESRSNNSVSYNSSRDGLMVGGRRGRRRPL